MMNKRDQFLEYRDIKEESVTKKKKKNKTVQLSFHFVKTSFSSLNSCFLRQDG